MLKMIYDMVVVLESEVRDMLLSCEAGVVTREVVLWDRKNLKPGTM
jgi:hypothetical protein